MNSLTKPTVQRGLLVSSISIHALVFFIISAYWQNLPATVVTHYGLGGPDLYEPKSIASVFYFSIVALSLELILLLVWGATRVPNIFANATLISTLKAFLPVCIFLLSSVCSAVNLVSVFHVAPSLRTATVVVFVVVLVFIPVVALTIMNFSQEPESKT
ncbi:MAG: hypothetical protein Q4D85_08370 [Corynebacterium sp.]|uniref:hypothetical protein n=1 Tax=Corynebacterium sp. TaxID=1720 RepID=UPI0026DB1821|nr:hypothetical protein [Corynebacterium sp.]MDO5098761.1 hypothetical protein [Corynebacterium sp.]